MSLCGTLMVYCSRTVLELAVHFIPVYACIHGCSKGHLLGPWFVSNSATLLCCFCMQPLQATVIFGEPGVSLLDPDVNALDLLGSTLNSFGGQLFDKVEE